MKNQKGSLITWLNFKETDFGKYLARKKEEIILTSRNKRNSISWINETNKDIEKYSDFEWDGTEYFNVTISVGGIKLRQYIFKEDFNKETLIKKFIELYDTQKRSFVDDTEELVSNLLLELKNNNASNIYETSSGFTCQKNIEEEI